METLETLHNTSSSSSLTMNQSAAGAGVSGLGGSHCWEEDGSIHSVCIFVLSVSGVCTIATMLTVYRVIQMILAAVREPTDIKDSLRKYKLQPGRGAASESEDEAMEMTAVRAGADTDKEAEAAAEERSVNHIQLVETTVVTLTSDTETEEEDADRDTSTRDTWLC